MGIHDQRARIFVEGFAILSFALDRDGHAEENPHAAPARLLPRPGGLLLSHHFLTIAVEDSAGNGPVAKRTIR
jgi:hypothetical protein